MFWCMASLLVHRRLQLAILTSVSTAVHTTDVSVCETACAEAVRAIPEPVIKFTQIKYQSSIVLPVIMLCNDHDVYKL